MTAKKSKPAEDVAEEELFEDGPPKKATPKPRSAKPGPKLALSESNKAIANAGAKALAKATKGRDNHGLTEDEAQSITTPIMRMIMRRMPAWLKKLSAAMGVSKLKMNPDDIADLQEIALTLGKYTMRLSMVLLNEFISGMEQKQAQGSTPQAQPTPIRRAAMPAAPMNAGPDLEIREAVSVSNHSTNPLIQMLPGDYGLTEG